MVADEMCPAVVGDRERASDTPLGHGWFPLHVVPWPYFRWPFLRREVTTCLYCGARAERLRWHERLAQRLVGEDR